MTCSSAEPFGRRTSEARRRRPRLPTAWSTRCSASASVRVGMRVVPLGTPTGVLPRELSAAGLAEVPATLCARERRLQTVAEREPQLRRDRRVVLVPIREERCYVATQLPEERANRHIPP